MGHRLPTILAALSLLLLIGDAIGWIGCYYGWHYGSSDYPQTLQISHGQSSLTLQYLHLDGPLFPPGQRGDYSYGSCSPFSLNLGVVEYRRMPIVNAHAFRVVNERPAASSPIRQGANHIVRVRLPWFLLLAAILPTWWAIFHRQRERTYRRTHGLCPTCGYDLRASKERCPECGTVIDPALEDSRLLPENARQAGRFPLHQDDHRRP